MAAPGAAPENATTAPPNPGEEQEGTTVKGHVSKFLSSPKFTSNLILSSDSSVSSLEIIHRTHRFPLGIIFILVSEFAERFAFHGTKAVLTLYFMYFLKWNENSSTAVYHAFSGLCYFISILGAIIADSWLGRYNTIASFHGVYLLGQMLLILSAVPLEGGQVIHTFLAVLSLFLLALGAGTIKPCVLAFIGDQFHEQQRKERRRVFSVAYLVVNFAALLSMYVTPTLREDVTCFGSDCYMLAFGLPGIFMLMALFVFAFGIEMYNKRPLQENFLLEVCKCIEFALSNRLRNRSSQIPKREHWLDWAAEKYPKQLIAEVKALTRMLFLLTPLPMFWALFNQQGSRWTLQATRMDGNMGLFVIKPDQVQGGLPRRGRVWRSEGDVEGRSRPRKGSHRPIRKMVVGMILAALAFAMAAVVEIKVNETTRTRLGLNESLLQILNLADGKVRVILQGYRDPLLFLEPIVPFQDPSPYSLLQLGSKHQQLSFLLQAQSTAIHVDHNITGRKWYSLVIHKDSDSNSDSVASTLVEDMDIKPPRGTAAMRFFNTLDEDVNISLDQKDALWVPGNYGVSAYRIMEKRKQSIARCQTQSKTFTLPLGTLTFGTSYTIFIMKNSEEGLWAWKTSPVLASTVSILWQVPQYVLITAAEVMFSVTSFEFLYAEAPASMKSVIQAAWLLTVAFGNLIVLIVAEMDLLVQWAEFLLFACLLLGVCLLFSIMGYHYVPWAKTQQIIQEEQKQQRKREKKQRREQRREQREQQRKQKQEQQEQEQREKWKQLEQKLEQQKRDGEWEGEKPTPAQDREGGDLDVEKQ
ncbi:solute carrier family 15 member 2-like isoform X2 [Tachyglossus aculeatus]|uniref:solute carrier family 15 member 2-like isoform X2 n=1 Tax=Tachyglossus aculeatus TaxID=9261 RepID=UPI0018F55F0B|nr:solute carrier family 15 member 2-like isoform X2 [Tachyglossus aculeatus]